MNQQNTALPEAAMDNPSLDPVTGTFEPRLQDQQIELVYTQAPVSLAAALAVAVVITLGLWGVADHSLLLLWLGTQVIQTVVRLGVVYRYRQLPAADNRDPLWGRLFFAGTLVSGVIWGCIGLLLNPVWPVEYQVFTILCLAGVLAGAITSYAAVFSIYTAFMLPAIMIPAQSMITNGTGSSTELGLLFSVFAGALLIIARNYNRSIQKSLLLRQENSDLLHRMSLTNASLENEVLTRTAAENELLCERRLFVAGPVTVFRWRAEAGWPIEYVSGTVSQFGFDAASLMREQLPYREMMHPDDVQRVEGTDFIMGSGDGRFLELDYRINHADGRVRWVYSYTVPVENADGDVTHYAGYILDITDRKHAEFALKQEKDRALVTLHSIADAVITTDVNRQIEYLNPMAERMTGWESSIARGLPISRVFCLFDEDSRDTVEDPVAQCLETGTPVKSGNDRILRRHDGEQFYIQYSSSPILNDTGSPLGAVLVFHDVTAARDMERKISYQASHDALTGLVNRTEFEARLAQVIRSARNENASHTLLYLDLDSFRIVNDTGCHEAGDTLLVKIRSALQQCLRDSDVLARLGGDEFGMLLRDCSLEDAVRIADDMLEEVRRVNLDSNGRTFDVSASIGMVQIDRDSETATGVMSAADLACYAAKDRGGNRFHVYQSSDQELARRHDEMQWVSRVKDAIEADRFVLYYQDIVPVKPCDHSRSHFEVLVRMLDEDGDIIPPGIFLTAAERYNLIAGVDRWVVSNSLAWYAQHLDGGDAGSPGIMSINLSGASITSAGFLRFIKDELQDKGVPPENICFEITETAAVTNRDAAIEFIGEMRRLGCRFALDDFGSGLSTFAYLKNFPVDYLKIDGSLVKDMDTDAVDRAMVSAIHQLGKAVGIQTIAEFVENQQILEGLGEIGVDFAQGYGISRPRPLDELPAARKQSA